MRLKDELMEVKEELEKVKETGTIPTSDESAIATEVIKLLKGSVKRLYVLLLITLLFLVISLVDSFYQRHVIIGILEDFEIVEETIIETTETTDDYNITQESGDGGNNNFINGDGNEVNN